MGELTRSQTISEEDYSAIEEAVMETARGRWFLTEYARRNRVSNTENVLEAIQGLKTYITKEHESVDVLQMRLNIVDMMQKIEQIKTEVANTGGSSTNLSAAQGELNVVVDETEKATSDILNAAEQIQGLVWEIRESGNSEEECEKIDMLATEIYMACSFQDLTGQRVRKVVQLASMLEKRLKAMTDVWGKGELERYVETQPKDEVRDLTNGPAMPDVAQGQADIDVVMGNEDNVGNENLDMDYGALDVVWEEPTEDDSSSEDDGNGSKSAVAGDLAYDDGDDEVFLIDEDFEEQKVAKQDVAEQDVAEQDVAEQDVAEQDVAKQDVAEQDVAEQDVAEQDVAEQDVAEQDVAEQDVEAFTADGNQEDANDLRAVALSRDNEPEPSPQETEIQDGHTPQMQAPEVAQVVQSDSEHAPNETTNTLQTPIDESLIPLDERLALNT